MIYLALAMAMAAIVPATLAYSASRQRRARRLAAIRDSFGPVGNEDFAAVISKCVGRHPVEPQEVREQ